MYVFNIHIHIYVIYAGKLCMYIKNIYIRLVCMFLIYIYIYIYTYICNICRQFMHVSEVVHDPLGSCNVVNAYIHKYMHTRRACTQATTILTLKKATAGSLKTTLLHTRYRKIKHCLKRHTCCFIPECELMCV